MQVITSTASLPQSAEWVMSSLPDSFTVVLENTSSFFPQYDRLALTVNIEGKVGESDDLGKSKFSVAIKNLHSLDGAYPGECLHDHPDTKAYVSSEDTKSRLTAALDLWGETITDQERMDVWLSGGDIAEVLLRLATSQT